MKLNLLSILVNLPVYCGACERTHILILSGPILEPADPANIPVRSIGVVALSHGSKFLDTIRKPFKEKNTEDIKQEQPKPKENIFEIYYTCPEKTSEQCVPVISSSSSKGNEIQVLGLLDQDLEGPSIVVEEDNAPVPASQVVSALAGYQKKIFVTLSKKDPDKEIEFKVTKGPMHGKIDQSGYTDQDISRPILYTGETPSWDNIEIEVYYKNSPGWVNKCNIAIIVNNFGSYYPGPERQQLVNYSKDLITSSVDKLKDFTKFIVPTVSGIISVHIGLFSFFEMENISQLDFWKTLWYVSPVFPLVLSLFLFHYAIVPSVTLLTIGNLNNLRGFRESVLNGLKNKITIAFVLFSLGLILMGITLIPAPSVPQEGDSFDFLTYQNLRFNYEIEYPDFWDVSVHNNEQRVIFRQLGASDSPSVELLSGALQGRPKLIEFAFQKGSELGTNASTPFPDRLGNVQSAYYISASNSTADSLRIISLDDLKNNFYIFDYTASKIDYKLYLDKVVERMKDSFSVKQQ